MPRRLSERRVHPYHRGKRTTHRSRRARRARSNPLAFVLATCPGYHLGRAYKRVTREFEEEFRSSGSTDQGEATDLTLAQFALLVNVGVTGSATGTEVAERLGSDISTISRTMELIVRRGLVSQRRGDDRRVRIYELTDAGRSALATALPRWKRAKYRVLRRADGEWRSTLRVLRRLTG